MTPRPRRTPVVATAAAAGLLLVLAGCADPNAPAGASSAAAPTVTVTETATETAPTDRTETGEPSPSDTTSGTDTTETPSQAPSGSGVDSPNLEAAVESAMEAYLEFHIDQVLADNGVTLSKGPTCKADLSRKAGSLTASGTVSCTGTTSQGVKVKATFTGSATAGAGCDGKLVVKVGGRTVVNEPLDECIVEVA